MHNAVSGVSEEERTTAWKMTALGLCYTRFRSKNDTNSTASPLQSEIQGILKRPPDDEENLELDGTWRLVEVQGGVDEATTSLCINSTQRCEAVISASAFEGKRIKDAAAIAWGLPVLELKSELGGGFLRFVKVRAEGTAAAASPQAWSSRFEPPISNFSSQAFPSCLRA
eukprot:2796040-Rhodomonas_salina.2